MNSKSKKSKKNVLPKIGNQLHLSKYGYSLKDNKKKRQASLKRASKKNSTLAVLRRTNLIANYSSWHEKNYKKLRNDVEFLKKLYKKEKKD